MKIYFYIFRLIAKIVGSLKSNWDNIGTVLVIHLTVVFPFINDLRYCICLYSI